MQPELRKLIQDAILQARAELMIYDWGTKARRKAAIHELEYCGDSFVTSVSKVMYKSTGDSNVKPVHSESASSIPTTMINSSRLYVTIQRIVPTLEVHAS